ncbi:TetR/AcrR family transcriptional regulator [Alteromonas sp. AMM-1]|uniref:TetR/AcrR family transcriptional regulator n=1 Tax=Alteromonas sp. AMM-1 TaxID=3394233 RepID=UPI0039A75346
MTSGRKREFDAEVALEAAMQVFWQKGYAGASLADLIEGMGINKPSMYRAFGNKEALFVQATQRYLETRMQPHLQLLQETQVPLRERIKKHMMSIISMQCNAEHAKGCYLVLCQSEMISGNVPPEAAEILAKADALPKQLYTALFSESPEAVAAGLHSHAEANALALYTLLKGTASMARCGAGIAELEFAVDSMLDGLFQRDTKLS